MGCIGHLLSLARLHLYFLLFIVYVVLLPLLPDVVLFICCWLASAVSYCSPFICEGFICLCVPTCCFPIHTLLPCEFLIGHVVLWLVQELPCTGVVGREVPVFVLWNAFMELTFFFEICQAGSVCIAVSFQDVYAVCTLMQAWVHSCTEGGSVFLAASCTFICFCFTVSNIVSEFLAFQTSFWFG